MALDAGFKAMLTVPLVFQRATGKDQWGNETYAERESLLGFIDASNASPGRGTVGRFKESQQAATATVYLDAIVGAKITDKIEYDGTDHWVTDLVTYKDETGSDLLQVVTVNDQKKG